MISKNLFLARLMEDLKRRAWLILVSVLLFVISIPTYVAMNISLISAREELIRAARVNTALYEFANNLYSGNSGLFLFTVVFAIICGIQGFSYLYDRSKVDFYHSKPVKTTTRFFTIWTNGIMIFLVPFLIGTLINLVFFAANGILDVKLFSNAWIFVLMSFGLYLCIYHLAILALMMTGKIGVTIMGIGVFLFYEVCIRMLFAGYSDYFFRFFYINDESNWVMPLLSPFTYLSYYDLEKWSGAFTFFCLLLFAAAVLFLALWCYKKRPAERAGSAMAFPVVQPLIKIGIAVPVMLFAGIVTSNIMEYRPVDGTGNPGFPIFIGILALLITCGLIQVIFEADIKGIFHKKIHIVISFVIAACIALIFRFDLPGYDTRMPSADKIEYATLTTESGQRYYRSYLDEDMKWISKQEYVDKYMKLTGETAKAVRDLAAHSEALFLEQPNKNQFYETYKDTGYIVVSFRLKNGNMFTRQIPVALREKEVAAYIEMIETSEEFIRYNEPAMSEELLSAVESGNWQIEASWGNNILNEALSRKQAIQLLKCYREDLLINNYAARSSEMPAGNFRLSLKTGVSYYGNLEFMVYPSFTNCIQYLKENGFETEAYISAENVEKIVVTRDYPTENEEIDFYDETTYESTPGVYFTADYEKAQEVESKASSYSERALLDAILASAYPGSMDWEYWYQGNPIEENYRISVFFKENTPCFEEYGSVADFYFLKDSLPDFVKADLPDNPDTTE